MFAHLHEILIPLLYEPTGLGQITLADWFGRPVLGLGVLIILFGGGILLIGRLWEADGD